MKFWQQGTLPMKISRQSLHDPWDNYLDVRRMTRHLIREDSQAEKEYLVRVDPLIQGRAPSPDALKRLQLGLSLDGVALKPAKVSWQNEEKHRFVLREGRKRQIRRLCELMGFKVTALKRVQIGSVVLGGLSLGQWRYLHGDERI